MQQMIINDSGKGKYKEVTPPMLGIWDTVLAVGSFLLLFRFLSTRTFQAFRHQQAFRLPKPELSVQAVSMLTLFCAMHGSCEHVQYTASL